MQLHTVHNCTANIVLQPTSASVGERSYEHHHWNICMTSSDIDCRDNAGDYGGGHNYILSLGGNTGGSCAYIGELDSKFATVLVLKYREVRL